MFTVSFSVDNPFLLAIGGSKGKLEVSVEDPNNIFPDSFYSKFCFDVHSTTVAGMGYIV